MLLHWVTTILAAVPLIWETAGHVDSHSQAEIQAELQLRSFITQHSKRSLAKCANSPATKALHERAIARRVTKAHTLRQQRGLQNGNILSRRDRASLRKWSSLSHHSSSSPFTLTTPPSEIFSSAPTCALVPESTIGPYYVSGELLRTNLTDSQSGVPIHLDIQFLSTTTCSPIPDSSSPLLLDIWHCNATGVYSGVSAPGQGGPETTHGRGVQATDSEGVVQFDTLFPGHYAGRATHIHVMATSGVSLLPNNTFTGGKARHIGQLYFDQDLRNEIEKLAPYNSNKQTVTSNLDDGLAPASATEEYDPFLNYVWLGEKLEDGLLMWITIAVDLESDYSDRVNVAEHFDGHGDGGDGGGVVITTGGTNTPDATGTAAGDVVSRSSSAAAARRWGAMGMGMAFGGW